IGWAIGRGEEYDDHKEQDRVESEALYDLLENEIIPTFYKQSLNGLPREWIAMMKASMQKVCPYFNTNRMVRDYLHEYYMPAAERWSRLVQDDMRAAKQLAEWKQRVSANWQDVKILDITGPKESERKVGELLFISASLETGNLKPEDLCVEVYYGQLDTNCMIEKGTSMRMEIKNQDERGAYVFQANIPCKSTGKHGFSIRVLPHHPELPNPHEMGLIKWFKGD
ncbi:MAG: glycosyltransferase family 1 protein, partial [Calditrichaeota bacterium]|nr:glycosyltransferase family 1 protein [Calditrichota bacterium]